jgi:hypothetical protein
MWWYMLRPSNSPLSHVPIASVYVVESIVFHVAQNTKKGGGPSQVRIESKRELEGLNSLFQPTMSHHYSKQAVVLP